MSLYTIGAELDALESRIKNLLVKNGGEVKTDGEGKDAIFAYPYVGGDTVEEHRVTALRFEGKCIEVCMPDIEYEPEWWPLCECLRVQTLVSIAESLYQYLEVN